MALLLSFAPLLSTAEEAGSPVKPGEYLPFKNNDLIMIVGDSIGGPHDIIPLLQKACPEKNLRFFNCSIGTTTIKDALQRIDRDLIRSDLGADADVGWYFIMFGANDSGVKELAEGGYESYYRRLISALKRRTGAKVIPICTVPFSGGAKRGNDQLGSFADVLKALGKEYGLKVVDLFHPCLGFIDQRGDAAFAKDGIHPSAEAHVFMAETVLKELGFDALPEHLTVDLKNNKWSGSDGCAVERISASGAGYTVALRNLYDFEHVVALRLEGSALDAYLDSGERLALKDGRIVVPLPAPLRCWVPDLKRVQALATAGNLTDIAERAGKIQAALRAAAGCTIHLVPPGGPAFKAGPRRNAFPVEAESMALWQAAAALNPADKRHRELQKAAARLVQEGGDVRLNFPKQTVPNTGVGGCRFATSIGRAGAAAVKPNERFEVAFYNFGGSSVRGAISVALPPSGWRVAALGKTQFAGLPPGERFVAEFQLTGDETCTHQGELTAKVEYEVQGVKLKKQAAFKLFALWLGVGPFCDRKESEQDSLSVKLATVYPPENTIDPKAVYRRYDGKTIAWTPVRSLYGYIGIDVAGQLHWGHWDKFLEGTETEVFTPWQPPAPVYFAQWVYCPEKRDVTLLPIFCSKVAKVWVNRKLILEFNTENKPGNGLNWTQVRTWFGAPTTVPATLAKGWNEVLFKVTSYTPWGDPSAFGCQILDKDMQPIPGLLGSCAPPR
ncbi:MAG: GDSL-type esterase/lipase family protein [Thermoguttaceae bacterium]